MSERCRVYLKYLNYSSQGWSQPLFPLPFHVIKMLVISADGLREGSSGALKNEIDWELDPTTL